LRHAQSTQDHARTFDDSLNVYPTHLLYRSIAYRISEKPLYIGHDPDSGNTGVQARRQPGEKSSDYFSVQLRGREVVLKNLSPEGTDVNDARISGSTVVQLGQTIRVGTPGEQLQVIASVELDK
jgi:hypothetical protein